MSHTRAFVLSGGASLGAVQVGMLRALYEHDIAPDLIVGACVGAINGAYIASRPQSPETAEGLARVWNGVGRGDVFPLSPLSSLGGLLGRRDHVLSGAGLRRTIASQLEFDWIEDAPIPLHVLAVDLLSGAEALLSDGPALKAIMASTAIPGVFPVVERGGLRLIDGGVTNNTPISHALALGASEIFVLPTGVACASRTPPRGALGTVVHATTLLIQRRLIEEIDRYCDEAKLVVLPPPCPLAVLPVDFSHSEALIEQALRDARAFLDGGGLKRPPVRMASHSHPARAIRPGRVPSERRSPI
jgi:NTE family protein